MKILKTEFVRNRINISICKADYFFDVIATGNFEDLDLLKIKLGLDTEVFVDSKLGGSLIVIDTCDEFSFAKQLMKNTIWKINKEIKEWK